MDIEQLTQKDKYFIAEFVFSFGQNVLIKADLTNLIDVMIKHNVEGATTVKLESCAILFLLRKSLDCVARRDIMVQYYKGELTQ